MHYYNTFIHKKLVNMHRLVLRMTKRNVVIAEIEINDVRSITGVYFTWMIVSCYIVRCLDCDRFKSDQDQCHCAKNIILDILKIRVGSLLTCKICTEMFEWLAQLLFLIELRSLCLKVIVLLLTLIWIEWKRSFLWNQKSQQCEKRRSALSLNGMYFLFLNFHLAAN